MDFAFNLKGKHFIAGTIEVLQHLQIGQLIFYYLLMLGMMKMPPYIYILRDRDGKLREVYGFVNEILLFLAEKFKFT